MDITHLKHYPPEKVRALCGLTLSAVGTLLAQVLPALGWRRQVERTRRPERQRAGGGGRRRRLKPDQDVLGTLVYLRHHVAHAVVGERFGVSADTSENTFHEVVFVLRAGGAAQRWDAEKRGQKSEPRWTPGEGERVLLDRVESPVRRPSRPARQKRIYAGKKQPHTLQSQGVTEAKGESLALDPGHRGPTADKRGYEQSTVEEQYPSTQKQGDLAYQGSAGVSVPHKKPPGGRLTEEQRAENRRLAAGRVQVEHGIRRSKGWRIVRDDYRLVLGLFPLSASTVVGLVQLVRIVG